MKKLNKEKESLMDEVIDIKTEIINLKHSGES
jgi:hypothetical protein